MKNILPLFILLVSIPAFSQSGAPAVKKIKFSSVNQFGLLNGSNGASYDIRTINGISYRNWLVGLGVGIDNYESRSVPVFMSLRKEFSHKINVPFLYADGGLNYTWLSSDQKGIRGGDYSTSPGMYLDGGIGMKIPTKNNFAVLLSTGFSYKQTHETITREVWITPWPMPGGEGSDNAEHWNRKYRRIVVRVGLQF